MRHAPGCNQKEGSEGPRVVAIRWALDMIGLEENESSYDLCFVSTVFFTHYAVIGFESSQA